MLFKTDELSPELVHDFLTDLPKEFTLLLTFSCLGFHLTEFFLEELLLFGPDLLDVELWVPPFVVGDQVGIRCEDFGAFTAFGKVKGSAYGLMEDVLIGLECLLFDFNV